MLGKKMKRITLIAALTLVATNTQAANWVLVAENRQAAFYIDSTSIQKEANGNVDYWLKRVNDRPIRSVTVPELTTAAKIHSIINCKENTIATITYQGISENGNVTDLINFPADYLVFTDISPKSVREDQLNFVCHYKSSR